MEYISAEEFLKQPVEVQKAFVDWWKPRIFDLYHVEFKDEEEISSKNLSISQEDINEFGIDFFPNGIDGNVFPLLSEGQLRTFIEDKTESKILRIFLNEFEVGTKTFKRYCIHFTNARIFMNQSDSLFQSYWKVACQIASKEVVEHGQIK